MSLQKFKIFVETLVSGGYLDEDKEREALIYAQEIGLNAQESLETLQRVCFDNNAQIESHEISLFIQEIESMIDDGFLDNDEAEELIEKGIEHFEGSTDPLEKSRDILTFILRRQSCLTEAEYRQKVESILEPNYNLDGKLNKFEWLFHKEYLLEYASNKGVDLQENDLDEVLESVFKEMGMKLIESTDDQSSKQKAIAVIAVSIITLLGLFFSISNEDSPIEKNSKVLAQSVGTQSRTVNKENSRVKLKTTLKPVIPRPVTPRQTLPKPNTDSRPIQKRLVLEETKKLSKREVKPTTRQLKTISSSTRNKSIQMRLDRGKPYALLVSSYKDSSRAKELVKIIDQELNGIRSWIFKADLEEKGIRYRVLVGEFKNKRAAMKLKPRLHKLGLRPLIRNWTRWLE